jgi:hypothetical protein
MTGHDVNEEEALNEANNESKTKQVDIRIAKANSHSSSRPDFTKDMQNEWRSQTPVLSKSTTTQATIASSEASNKGITPNWLNRNFESILAIASLPDLCMGPRLGTMRHRNAGSGTNGTAIPTCFGNAFSQIGKRRLSQPLSEGDATGYDLGVGIEGDARLHPVVQVVQLNNLAGSDPPHPRSDPPHAQAAMKLMYVATVPAVCLRTPESLTRTPG